MLKSRYLTKQVVEDLAEKMVFVGGCRQVGKTTFARKLVAREFRSAEYFNWDNRQDRARIMNSDWPGDAELLILDEIHKYKRWKNLVKGEYDKLKERYRFMVTGSARLDVYRRGGDSMQGRYHYYRLHPFTLAEMLKLNNDIQVNQELVFGSNDYEDELEALDKFGGFPEPLVKADERFIRRWHNEKLERLFREDITELEQIRSLGSMKLLADILPARVGALLSINSLRQDLEVSHRAVSHWIDILETVYYHYRVYPYTKKVLRSIKKEPKLYLWDWSEVEDPAARFENLIGSHLLKLVHYLYDYEGYKAELYFLRNVEKKEVDFLVTVDREPWFAVEVKMGDNTISPNLYYFKERLQVPYLYQVVKKPGIDRFVKGIRLISAGRFLSGLM